MREEVSEAEPIADSLTDLRQQSAVEASRSDEYQSEHCDVPYTKIIQERHLKLHTTFHLKERQVKCLSCSESDGAKRKVRELRKQPPYRRPPKRKKKRWR